MGGRDVFVDYGWIRLLYTGDGDMQEVFYHLNQARWHEHDMTVFRSLIAPGQTVIDVGANMGFVTAMFASLVGDQGRVLSFEPSPVVFAKLKQTIAANGLAQVTPFNVGCGASTSTASLSRVGPSSGNASMLGEGSDATEVQIVRLDDVPEVVDSRVSLLKIDTEGYEPEVLAGATALVRRDRPIIYLEMGGDYLDSTNATMELLGELGYGINHVRQIDWRCVGNGSDFFFMPCP
jgi:FkbM family methyltransferase